MSRSARLGAFIVATLAILAGGIFVMSKANAGVTTDTAQSPITQVPVSFIYSIAKSTVPKIDC